MLFDSESGNPASKFSAGAAWSRDGIAGWGQDAHTRSGSWANSEPASVGRAR